MDVQRYAVLDALRGIAAIVVVGFHLAQFGMVPVVVPRGYLAVDFFFILSGFVIAHAYEKDLQTHLSLRSFVVKRVIRLYPLALLGAGMGFSVLLLKWWFFPDKVNSLGQLFASGVFNLAMLPSFFGVTSSSHDVFPGNGPLWSLFFELVANLLWAVYGVWLRTSTLVLITLGNLIVLALFANYNHSLNLGYDTVTFWGGLARVGFGFPLGVIIYREQHRICVNTGRYLSFVLSVLMIAVFAIPVGASPDSFAWLDLLLVSIGLPAIIILGITQTSSNKTSPLLGDLSYPIYVLHFPILLVMSGLSQSVLSKWNIHVIASASFIMIPIFAWLAWRFYDAPLRRILTSMARKGSPVGLLKFKSAREFADVKHKSDEEQVNVRI